MISDATYTKIMDYIKEHERMTGKKPEEINLKGPLLVNGVQVAIVKELSSDAITAHRDAPNRIGLVYHQDQRAQ